MTTEAIPLSDKYATPHQIASGYDFEPLPDGTVLIEFFGDDSKTFNEQLFTKECLESVPLVSRQRFW